jgi:tetratricopeptide (TPR) repeat protein
MKRLFSRSVFVVLALGLASCVTNNRVPTDVQTGFRSEIKGEFDQAIESYTRALDGGSLTDDQRVATYVRRAYAYMNKGEFEKAIADADTAIQLKPSAEFTYAARAAVNARRQQYDLAIADLDVALSLRKTASLYNSRGQVYAQSEQLDQALADFNEALKLHPRYAEAYESRSAVFIKRGDYEHGLSDLDHAIGLQPDNGLAYNGRGMVYARTGQYDKAYREFSTALIFQPKVPAFYSNRAHMAFALDRYDAAADDMAQSIKLLPSAGFDVVWLHVFRHKAGQDDRDEFQRNVAAMNQQPWPHLIASVYLGTTAPEQVRKMAQQATSEAYQIVTCQATFHLGYADLLRGQDGNARPAMQEAAKICPELSAERRLAAREIKGVR